MNKTLFDKIWNKHIVRHVSDDMSVLYIDQHFIHEVTSPQAFDGLKKRGLRVFRPKQTLATTDHNVPTKNQHLPIKDPLSAQQVETLKENCHNFGIELFEIGHKNQGIVHVIGPELGMTKPGMTIVCGDSHTSTHGAFGCIAFGIGTSQVESVLASQCLILSKPRTMKIEITNDLQKGVTAKDVILYIISKLGAKGATGHFVEYTGDVISKMSMEERMTIANMSIEMGARGGMMGIDQITLDYLEDKIELSQAKKEEWIALNSDSDAQFDKEICLDASQISPMVTVGTSPDTGIAIESKVGDSEHISDKALEYMGFNATDQISKKGIDYVFIGSCTNGRIEDLRSVANIVNGRRKADHVTVWVVPGSQQVRTKAIEEGLDKIFMEAGFEFREPGCSACLAMNDDKITPGSICVSTSNRNFEGRQGKGARTILASPITAAASAITGKVTNPLIFLNEENN